MVMMGRAVPVMEVMDGEDRDDEDEDEKKMEGDSSQLRRGKGDVYIAIELPGKSVWRQEQVRADQVGLLTSSQGARGEDEG